jgi:hypothetical protein
MWAASWVNGEFVPCIFTERAQRSLVLLELFKLHEGYKATGWKLVEPQEALEALIPCNLFVFVGSIPMCISANKPWFSAELVLAEEFVGGGIDTDTAADILRAACEMQGANRFVVGTRAAANMRHAGLAKLYQKSGLSVSTIELMGVVHGKQVDPKIGQ